ncbi:MAG: NTPase [Candidatus Bathyarchaeia archaeon]
MQKRVLLLTGDPGIGKTTVLAKTVDILRAEGYTVGGIITRENRQDGTRVGFEIMDISTGKRGWLAHINQPAGPQIGKYKVNIENLTTIGAEAILAAIENCCVIVIDEIGPMELLSEKFKQAVSKALESSKPVIAVIHRRAQDKLIVDTRKREDAELIIITPQNRECLPKKIAIKIIKILSNANK